MGKDTIHDNKLIIEDNIVSQKATRSNKPVGEAVSTDEQIEQLYKDLLAEIAKYRPNKNLDMVEKGSWKPKEKIRRALYYPPSFSC